MQRALFAGRFQPLHSGHMWLFRQKLDKGIPIWIAVRDVAPDDKNPFTPEQSAQMIRKAFDGEDVLVTVIPDIESVNYGRGVGYEVNEFQPPTDIGAVSATQIRKQIDEGSEDWKKVVDSKIWDDVISLLKKPEDCGCGTADVQYIGGAEMCGKCGKTWR